MRGRTPTNNRDARIGGNTITNGKLTTVGKPATAANKR
jgi:hypothetical protein